MSTKCPDTGRTYYYDLLTRETTWHKPEGEIRSRQATILQEKDAAKLASVPVVAQHAEYERQRACDGAATSAGRTAA